LVLDLVRRGTWATIAPDLAVSSRKEEVMPRPVVQCVAVLLLIAIATTGCATVEEIDVYIRTNRR
jgi:hypothetical protein